MTVDPLKSCRCGVALGPETPNEARVGPSARISRRLGAVPLITNPAMRTAPPVPTSPRVATSTSLLAVNGAKASRSQTSTRPMPVSPPAPVTVAVYAPGGNEPTMAESALPLGSWKAPAVVSAAETAVALAPEELQPELAATTTPLLLATESCGPATAPEMTKPESVGPTARTRSCLFAAPPTTNPAISELAPVPTEPRVEMFLSTPSLKVPPETLAPMMLPPLAPEND